MILVPLVPKGSVEVSRITVNLSDTEEFEFSDFTGEAHALIDSNSMDRFVNTLVIQSENGELVNISEVWLPDDVT
jgi:hypothetical protein